MTMAKIHWQCANSAPYLPTLDQKSQTSLPKTLQKVPLALIGLDILS